MSRARDSEHPSIGVIFAICLLIGHAANVIPIVF